MIQKPISKTALDLYIINDMTGCYCR